MRFATIAFTLLGAAASASASLFARQDSLPTCAISCTTSADLGSCTATDTTCLCTSQSFISSITQCVEAACTGSDLAAAIKYAQDFCLNVGVTLSVPASSAAASSAAASSTGASATATSPATHTSTSSAASATASKAAASTHRENAVLGLAAACLVALAL